MIDCSIMVNHNLIISSAYNRINTEPYTVGRQGSGSWIGSTRTCQPYFGENLLT